MKIAVSRLQVSAHHRRMVHWREEADARRGGLMGTLRAYGRELRLSP